MAQYTRPMYDDCRVCEDHAMNEKYVNYTLNPVVKETKGCLEPGGMPASSLNSSSTVPTRGNQVFLEGVLRGQFTDAACPDYNRDRVNTAISKYEKDLVPPPMCSPDMEPVHTRLGCPGEYQYNRIFEMNTVPNHPWEQSMGFGVNSRELAREVYRESNPFTNGTCGGTYLSRK